MTVFWEIDPSSTSCNSKDPSMLYAILLNFEDEKLELNET